MKEFKVYIFKRNFIDSQEVCTATEEILKLLEAEIAIRSNKTILNKSNVELKKFIAEGVSNFFKLKNKYIQQFLKGEDGNAIRCTISFDEIDLNPLLNKACIDLVECQNNLCNQALGTYQENKNFAKYKDSFLKNTSIKDFIENFMNTTVRNFFLLGGNIDAEIEHFKTSIEFLFNVFCKMPKLNVYPLSEFISLCNTSIENKLNLKVLIEDVTWTVIIKNIARNAMFRFAFSELLNMKMDIDKIKLFFADPSVIFSINSLLDYKNSKSVLRNLYEYKIGALCKYFCKTQSFYQSDQIAQQANNNLLSDESLICLNSLEENKYVDVFFEIIYFITVCQTQQENQKANQYKSVLDIFMKQENFRNIVVHFYDSVFSWKQLPIANDIPYISQDALSCIENFSSFCLFTLPCLLINNDQKIISILNGDNSELRSNILFHINKINNFGQGKLFALLVEHNVVTFEDMYPSFFRTIKANYKYFSDAISHICEENCEILHYELQSNEDLLRSITKSNFYGIVDSTLPRAQNSSKQQIDGSVEQDSIEEYSDNEINP